ncbi:uncharacterized protein LOC123535689 [Mercenaria mercenaria]|uniref:uncharacterized protein LOC123535689 n=1 Tax=Mercenaria mercenaria TaxID=6596 RepID=UPI00234F597E|nr:uncharacterized protein LOC123535689 [Mercenaria mercenaria]
MASGKVDVKAILESSTFVDKNEKESKLDFNDVEYIGLYFSAHWCPPCKAYTPQLAARYNDVLKDKKIEIVFISSDRDESAFKEYLSEMPWVALKFENRDAKEKLAKQFGISGIPTLVILDKDCELRTKDGRSQVMNVKKESPVEWKIGLAQSQASSIQKMPHAFEFAKELIVGKMALDILNTFGQGKLIRKGGKAFELEDLNDKEHIGLYFSAHWCPPCKGFTPRLAEYYQKYNSKSSHGKLEIVFVSSDQNEKEFNTYFAEMPWIALRFEDRDTKGMLAKKYGISGIPTLVILDKNGKLITNNGRGRVAEDPNGEKSWN